MDDELAPAQLPIIAAQPASLAQSFPPLAFLPASLHDPLHRFCDSACERHDAPFRCDYTRCVRDCKAPGCVLISPQPLCAVSDIRLSSLWKKQPMKITACLLFCFLLLVSCGGGKSDPAGSQEAAESTESSAREAAATMELQSTKEPVPKSQQTPQMRMAHAMLPYAIGDRMLPEDIEIGPLQDLIEPAAEALGAVSAIRSAFASLSEGRVPAELFESTSRALLASSLEYYVAAGMVPERIRVGRITSSENGQMRAAVRLFSAHGRSLGDVYLSREQGAWRIADLQLDLRSLEREYRRDEEKYFPSQYRSILRLF